MAIPPGLQMTRVYPLTFTLNQR